MNVINQAIKIEQLKNERSKMINPLQLHLIRDVEPRIRAIDTQIEELKKERNNLNTQRLELKNRISSHENHFDLIIKAYQTLSVNQKVIEKENKTK
jgi:chromosome segregation ATPase